MALDWLDEGHALTQSFSLRRVSKILNETQRKGLITELQCQLFFSNLGYSVLLPIAQDCRYDMIVDINGKLLRIQVKTSRKNNSNVNGLIFNTVSNRMNHTQGNIKVKYTKDDIDFFATYFENKVYLIPVEICTSSEKRLSSEKSRYSNQSIDLMQDYEAEKIIQRITQNIPVIVEKEENVVAQYDLNDNYIASFKSYMEAARSLGVTGTEGSSHIGQVCNGKRKTAYGYKWKKIS